MAADRGGWPRIHGKAIPEHRTANRRRIGKQKPAPIRRIRKCKRSISLCRAKISAFAKFWVTSRANRPGESTTTVRRMIETCVSFAAVPFQNHGFPSAAYGRNQRGKA
jgi:hypothetical protein